MAITIFKHSISSTLRRLVYASLFSTLAALAFSLVSFGTLSFFVTPALFLLTWIYHIVIIVLDNKRHLTSTRETYSTYSNKQPQIWGYVLAVLWFGDFLNVTVWNAILAGYLSDTTFDRSFMWLHVLEPLTTGIACGMMFAVAGVATKGKKMAARAVAGARTSYTPLNLHDGADV